MVDLEHKLKCFFVAAFFATAALEVVNLTPVTSAGATAIGDSKSGFPDQNEEQQKLIGTEPEAPFSAEREKNGPATKFEGFPSLDIRNYSGWNEDYINDANAIPSTLTSIADIAQVPDFADALTALDWVRRWADTGYWLEIDQWADYKAIAVAGYSPEIRYWLGRDNWASFNTVGASPLLRDPVSNTPKPRHRTVMHQPKKTESGSVPNGLRPHSKKHSAPHDLSTVMTLRALAVSAVRQMVNQPIFYVILACGFALLLWGLRKQRRT